MALSPSPSTTGANASFTTTSMQRKAASPSHLQQETHESNPYPKHLFDFLCWAIFRGPPWILAPQRSQTRYGLVFVQLAGFGPTKTRRDGSIPRPVW